MATELSSILGNELIVGIVPPATQRTFTGYAGADGITSMNMGHRGYVVPIKGKIRVTGGSYAAARANADVVILNIAALQYWNPGIYTHLGSSYYNAIFHGFRVTSEKYRFTNVGHMTVEFTINLIGQA